MRRLAIAMAVLAAGCGAEAPAADVANATALRPSATPAGRVVGIAKDDAAMNAAMARGQRSLPAFLARLNSPRPGDADFFVKYNLVPGGKAEFIWASDLTYRAGKLRGRLANAPLAAGFSEGQTVTIPLPSVVDWGYTQGAVMQGHYTTRVLFKTMAPGEVDALRAAFGWTAGLPD